MTSSSGPPTFYLVAPLPCKAFPHSYGQSSFTTALSVFQPVEKQAERKANNFLLKMCCRVGFLGNLRWGLACKRFVRQCSWDQPLQGERKEAELCREKLGCRTITARLQLTLQLTVKERWPFRVGMGSWAFISLDQSLAVSCSRKRA